MNIPRGHTAVMAQNSEAPGSLNDFPTPPWATRALFEIVLPAMEIDLSQGYVWEPACNRGLMAEVIYEYAAEVYASDVHDYGYGDAIGSFVGEPASLGLDIIRSPERVVDAVITNPPYRLAFDFVERALREAPVVAMLLRTAWVEGETRYFQLFSHSPPTMIAYFVERVPMHSGRWAPDGGTATSYSWFVWARGADSRPPLWIPPGQRALLSRDYDVRRAYELGALGAVDGTLL